MKLLSLFFGLFPHRRKKPSLFSGALAEAAKDLAKEMGDYKPNK